MLGNSKSGVVPLRTLLALSLPAEGTLMDIEAVGKKQAPKRMEAMVEPSHWSRDLSRMTFMRKIPYIQAPCPYCEIPFHMRSY